MPLPLGDSDAIAVAATSSKFRDEFLRHIEEGACPHDGGSSLDGILAPTDVHAAHLYHANIERRLEVVGSRPALPRLSPELSLHSGKRASRCSLRRLRTPFGAG